MKLRTEFELSLMTEDVRNYVGLLENNVSTDILPQNEPMITSKEQQHIPEADMHHVA